MTQWLELTIDAPAGQLDLITAQLGAHGITDIIIQDEADFLQFLEDHQAYWDYVDEDLRTAMAGISRVIFYLEDTPVGQRQLTVLREALFWSIAVRQVQEEDWAENWKQYFRPMPVGERLLIVPRWETVDPGDRAPLYIDPGLLFGTGSHPTTKLCLAAIERLVESGQQVLDLGAGSGILSIAALLLGAGHATACDIDPKAPDVIRENAAQNDLDERHITPLVGDVLAEGALRRRIDQEQYDLILANIVADVIIVLSDVAALWLAPGGHFVVSGIIDGREGEVEAALRAGRFVIRERHEAGGWHCFVCKLGKEC
ncbi:MAG: 50S ribosomal protein L11 methyltransferase [Oscillospiraceae bacterium]|nr:50S ribosomal protein L11 methyltransferase [Oscillospiraceae bacterium]